MDGGAVRATSARKPRGIPARASLVLAVQRARLAGVSTSCAFSTVLFDLDGTLVATDGFWIPAARQGATRAFEELGLARELPSADEWMGLVGLPLARGIAELLPELTDEQREHVLARCVEAEEELLRTRGAFLIPGVAETLTELDRQGVRMGVASNCGRDYLEHMLGGLGPLQQYIREGRCLESPGVIDKADMVADLLLTFGERDAVVVGDRAGDREAAWANGLPFVHCTFGFGGPGESEGADAVIETPPDLLPVLARRDEWIRQALDDLGVFGSEPPRAVRVEGAPASGKTLWAGRAARILEQEGVSARLDEADADRIVLGGSGPERTVFLDVAPEIRRRRLGGRDRIPGVTSPPGGRTPAVEPEPAVPEGALVLAADSPLGPVRRTARARDLSKGPSRA